jgi:3D (Asp-Asp-Asp) domain-containing protein
MKYIQKHALALAAGFFLGAILAMVGAKGLAQEVGHDLDKGALVSSSAFLPVASPQTPEIVAETIRVVVTAYSSTPEQTDDTPFITASGTWVRNGIVAANFLPMGTKIKLPDLYGGQVFVVEDRMHPSKYFIVDIWFPDYWQALNFGAKRTYIEVLEG